MEWILMGLGSLLLLIAILVWRLRLPHWTDLLRFNPLRLLRSCLSLVLLLVASGIIGIAVVIGWGG